MRFEDSEDLWKMEGEKWIVFDTDPNFSNTTTMERVCNSCLNLLKSQSDFYANGLMDTVFNPAYGCWKIGARLHGISADGVKELVSSDGFPWS